MVTKAHFLTVPYGGYYHRDIPEEETELTHSGPGTPCGEYLRRFWQPVVFLEELKELPVRVRVMGEDLVGFRDRSGKVGVLELHCCHRGTSLEFGQISERGLRCCYHGWLYDVDGKILDTPGEPPGATLKERLFHGAYPTYVYKGLVFVYMGPPDGKPAFPIYDSYEMAGYRQWVGLRHMLPGNWLQIKENSMDPAHLSFLHTIEETAGFPKETLKVEAEIDYVETPIGMAYIDSRRIGERIWVRMADYISPNIHQFGASLQDFTKEAFFVRPMMTQWSVPVDDTHTMNFRLMHVKEDQKGHPDVLGIGQDGSRPYEDRQRVPGDFDAQVSVYGGMARHSLEHLATTDRGVIMLRNMIRDGIRAVAAGQDPKGLCRRPSGIISTYCNDTITRVPSAPTPEEDRQLARATGRHVAEQLINRPPALAAQAK